METGGNCRLYLNRYSPISADSPVNREPSKPIRTKSAVCMNVDKTCGALKVAIENDTSPSVDRISWNVSFTWGEVLIVLSNWISDNVHINNRDVHRLLRTFAKGLNAYILS